MSDKINNANDPKLVSAVLQRMDELTRDQWLERLSWTPEGLEHKQVLPEGNLCTAKTSPDGGKTQARPEKKNLLARNVSSRDHPDHGYLF